MATLSFSFDTGTVPVARIIDAMALEYGYQATIPDPANPGQTIPNPQTKAQFGKAQIGRIIKEAVRNQERQAARAAAEAGITDIPIT
jgi:hypothetical protein